MDEKSSNGSLGHDNRTNTSWRRGLDKNNNSVNINDELKSNNRSRLETTLNGTRQKNSQELKESSKNSGKLTGKFSVNDKGNVVSVDKNQSNEDRKDLINLARSKYVIIGDGEELMNTRNEQDSINVKNTQNVRDPKDSLDLDLKLKNMVYMRKKSSDSKSKIIGDTPKINSPKVILTKHKPEKMGDTFKENFDSKSKNIEVNFTPNFKPKGTPVSAKNVPSPTGNPGNFAMENQTATPTKLFRSSSLNVWTDRPSRTGVPSCAAQRKCAPSSTDMTPCKPHSKDYSSNSAKTLSSNSTALITCASKSKDLYNSIGGL